MKVLVPLKQVAVLEGEVELEDGAVDPDSLEWALNEWDEFSVEAALQLVEAEGGEVVVATVGDEESEEALLAALAKGADRGVRIWDPALLELDPLAVARILAALAEREGPDLILAGVQSADAANAATGVALAGLLDWPRVAVVRRIESDGSSLIVERELEGGAAEVLRVPLPALLTIQTGANEPRYANLRAIKQARQKPLEVLEPAELGLDGETIAAASGARRVSLAAPERGGGAQLLEGDAEQVAGRIAEIVREEMAS